MIDQGPPSNSPPAGVSPVKMFGGAILIAIGGMMALLCGGCAALFSIAFIWQAMQAGQSAGWGLVIIPLVLGGIPAAVGAVMLWAGLKIVRRPKPRRGVTPKATADIFD